MNGRSLKYAAVILAAGASRRMGQPKALLPYCGETFLDRLIGVFAAHCGEVVVVVGHHAAEIQCATRRSARFVLNPDPDRGQLSSLQCGLAALLSDADGFFFTPVDQPGLHPETLQRLSAAKGVALITLPRFQGKTGHPALCSPTLVAEFLALPPGARTNEVIHRYRDRTHYVDVDDAAVIHGANTLEEYKKLVAEL